jgi:hypothetical protein
MGLYLKFGFVGLLLGWVFTSGCSIEEYDECEYECLTEEYCYSVSSVLHYDRTCEESLVCCEILSDTDAGPDGG